MNNDEFQRWIVKQKQLLIEAWFAALCFGAVFGSAITVWLILYY